MQARLQTPPVLAGAVNATTSAQRPVSRVAQWKHVMLAFVFAVILQNFPATCLEKVHEGTCREEESIGASRIKERNRRKTRPRFRLGEAVRALHFYNLHENRNR